MSQPTAHLPAADFTLDEKGIARSGDYDDVYFSARGATEETNHVFLSGNDLPARFHQKENFTIGELGFGTGLNFLMAWDAFIKSGAKGTLHFLSVEKYPLTPAQLSAALAHYPALEAYAAQLLDGYPLLLPGLHRIHFDRVSLTLGFGDAQTLLPQIHAKVDAWFLDGFSPAKNPAMWSDLVFENIARLSAPGTTLATFTVARAVRDGLQCAGFTTEKTKGFAHKREMLTAHYTNDEGIQRVGVAEPRSGWGQRRSREGGVGPPSIMIVGAGIAGATIAHALAMRGYTVTVLEKTTLASGASGNDAAVLYPQLTKYYQPATQWHFTGYDFMRRQLDRWSKGGLKFNYATPGMLKIAKDADDEKRLRAIHDSLQLDASIARWVERGEASVLAGVNVNFAGFWFAQGTWLSPRALCRALLAHENIILREHTVLNALTQGNDGWQLTLGDGEILNAPHVVLANAQAANDVLAQPLKLGISAGQVSALETALKLNAILCHKGYAIAQPDGLLVGATYDRSDSSGAVTCQNHQANLDELNHALMQPIDARIIGGRTSLRATTPNRLPYVGSVEEGLWVSVGHGSRGMISAPLAAELIASMISDEPLPVTKALQRAVDPLR